MRLDRFEPQAAQALLAAMAAEARDLTRSAAGDAPLRESRAVFMRYLGQGHEIPVGLPDGDLAADHAGLLREAFEAAYRRLFERHIPGAVIEILTWAVTVGAAMEPPVRLPPTSEVAGPNPIGRRTILLGPEASPSEIPVYARADFAPGAAIEGPALVVEPGTSTFVSAAFRAVLDAGGALVLERRT